MPNNQKERLKGLPSQIVVDNLVSHIRRKRELFLKQFNSAGQEEQSALAYLDRLKALSSWDGEYYQWLLKLADSLEGRVKDSREIPRAERRILRREVRRVLKQERAYVRELRLKIEMEESQNELKRLWTKMSERLKRSHPPRNAQFLLYLFLERKGREEAVGDALEDYSRYIKRVGKLRADILFWQEVGRCAWPFIKRVAAKIGGLIVIGEWLRKLTH